MTENLKTCGYNRRCSETSLNSRIKDNGILQKRSRGASFFAIFKEKMNLRKGCLTHNIYRDKTTDMKAGGKMNRYLKKILAIVLAMALVIGTGVFAADHKLKASEEGTSEVTAETPAEPEEIYESIDLSEEEIQDDEEAAKDQEEEADIQEEAAEEEITEAVSEPAADIQVMPAQFLSCYTSDGNVITLDAPEGALPAGCSIKAEPVDGFFAERKIEKAVEDVLEKSDRKILQLKAYDISIYDTDGNEIQPEIPVKVNLGDVNIEGEALIYHIDDDGNAEYIGTAAGDDAGFKAESFSVYAAVEAAGTDISFDAGVFNDSRYIYLNTDGKPRFETVGEIESEATENGADFRWTFRTVKNKQKGWWLNSMQINGTDVNVPEMNKVSEAVTYLDNATVRISLDSCEEKDGSVIRTYTVEISGAKEDIKITAANLNDPGTPEVIPAAGKGVGFETEAGRKKGGIETLNLPSTIQSSPCYKVWTQAGYKNLQIRMTGTDSEGDIVYSYGKTLSLKKGESSDICVTAGENEVKVAELTRDTDGKYHIRYCTPDEEAGISFQKLYISCEKKTERDVSFDAGVLCSKTYIFTGKGDRYTVHDPEKNYQEAVNEDGNGCTFKYSFTTTMHTENNLPWFMSSIAINDNGILVPAKGSSVSAEFKNFDVTITAAADETDSRLTRYDILIENATKDVVITAANFTDGRNSEVYPMADEGINFKAVEHSYNLPEGSTGNAIPSYAKTPVYEFSLKEGFTDLSVSVTGKSGDGTVIYEYRNISLPEEGQKTDVTLENGKMIVSIKCTGEGVYQASYKGYKAGASLNYIEIKSVPVKDLVITADSAQKAYDGKALSAPGFTVTADGRTYVSEDGTVQLDNGDTVTAQVSGTAEKDAGSYAENKVESYEVDNPDRYNVSVKSGSLSVVEKEIVLKSADITKEYDGNYLVNGDNAVEGTEDFAEGEGAEFTFTGSRKQTGSSVNSFEYTLNDGTDEKNYDIEVQFGLLTVTEPAAKTVLTVEGNSAKVIYTGEKQTAEGIKQTVFDADGHSYTVTGLTASGAEGTDGGKYYNNVTGTPVVLDEDGDNVSDAVAVEIKQGVLEIGYQVTVNYICGGRILDTKAAAWYEGDDPVEIKVPEIEGYTASLPGYDITGRSIIIESLDSNLVLNVTYTGIYSSGEGGEAEEELPVIDDFFDTDIDEEHYTAPDADIPETGIPEIDADFTGDVFYAGGFVNITEQTVVTADEEGNLKIVSVQDSAVPLADIDVHERGCSIHWIIFALALAALAIFGTVNYRLRRRIE